jgi:hypothetical protein
MQLLAALPLLLVATPHLACAGFPAPAPPSGPTASSPPSSSSPSSSVGGGGGNSAGEPTKELSPFQHSRPTHLRWSDFTNVALTSVLPELIKAGKVLLVANLAARLVIRLGALGALAEAGEGWTAAESYGLDPDLVAGLNQHELQVLAELVIPEAIETSFDDIAGLESVVQTLRELVVEPWLYPELYSQSKLLRPTSGVLLYGPPGCGKTMMAKALARESGACFLAVSPSTLYRKYVGDSNRMVRALFSLARKLQPCIIFIDEVDGILGSRQGGSLGDEPTHREVATEFMSLWDGLTTRSDSKIIVLGATNRPWDLDPAVQRRFRTIQVSMPDRRMRQKVLAKTLSDVELEEGFDLKEISRMTEGYSSSDLVELCRCAVADGPLRDAKARHRKLQSRIARQAPGSVMSPADRSKALRMRPLREADVLDAQGKVQPSAWAAEAYRAAWENYQASVTDMFRGHER